jgi:hypothetical protein
MKNLYLAAMGGDGKKVAAHGAGGEVNNLALVEIDAAAAQQGTHEIRLLKHTLYVLR